LSVKRSVLGKLFQTVGPHTEKAWWPNCVRVCSTMAARDVVELRQQRPVTLVECDEFQEVLRPG